MARQSKRIAGLRGKVDAAKAYPIDGALEPERERAFIAYHCGSRRIGARPCAELADQIGDDGVGRVTRIALVEDDRPRRIFERPVKAVAHHPQGVGVA